MAGGARGGGDGDTLLVPLVMGIAAGTVVVLILAMGFAYYFAWRRAEVRPRPPPKTNSTPRGVPPPPLRIVVLVKHIGTHVLGLRALAPLEKLCAAFELRTRAPHSPFGTWSSFRTC